MLTLELPDRIDRISYNAVVRRLGNERPIRRATLAQVLKDAAHDLAGCLIELADLQEDDGLFAHHWRLESLNYWDGYRAGLRTYLAAAERLVPLIAIYQKTADALDFWWRVLLMQPQPARGADGEVPRHALSLLTLNHPEMKPLGGALLRVNGAASAITRTVRARIKSLDLPMNSGELAKYKELVALGDWFSEVRRRTADVQMTLRLHVPLVEAAREDLLRVLSRADLQDTVVKSGRDNPAA